MSGILKRTGRELKYVFYVAVHPFKGFWDVKHEGEGSFRTAMVVLGVFVLVLGMSPYYTEWLYNNFWSPLYYNAIFSIVSYLLTFFAFCLANWCFTCLSDGEGTFKDICTNTAYSLMPMILAAIIQIALSHFFVLTERSLYDLVMQVATIWTGGLIVFGILVAHQYSLVKTLVICFVSIVGMLVMAYIGILFLNLIQQVWAFFKTLLNELRIVYSM